MVRGSLVDLLNSAPDHRLTVVAAGPGWGKTTAVAAWAGSEHHPADLLVAWVTLEPSSDDPLVFWHSVLTALHECDAIPADHVLSGLKPSAGVSDEVLLELQRGLAALPSPVLLVLDNFHLIEDPAILDALMQTVTYNSVLALMVLTRVSPPWPLHRLRLSADLLELSSNDLAFDDAEIRTATDGRGIDLSESALTDLLGRTQGWPAGVRLAIRFLQRAGASDGLAGFVGTEASVAEYLVAEVLALAPPEDQDFLLRTSVCDQLSGELAEAIVPGRSGQLTLEALAADNDFLMAQGTQRAWFRYHPLLRDLLQHTLRRDQPERFRDAHRAAARWKAQHGHPMAGLRHAISAEDWILFARLYTTAAGPALVGGRRAALESHLRDVPFSELANTPELELCRAGQALLTGRIQAIEGHAQLARSLMSVDGEQPTAAAASLLELLAMSGAWVRGDVQGVGRFARAAGAILDAADPFPAAEGYRSIAMINLAGSQFWSGELDRARATAASGLDLDGSGDAELAALSCWAHLANVDLLQTRLASAEQLATDVVGQATVRGWASHMQVAMAHSVLAHVRLLRGQTSGAAEALAAAEVATVGSRTLVAATALATTKAQLMISRGRPSAAQDSAAQANQMASLWPIPAFLADQLNQVATDIAVLTSAPGPAVVQAPDNDSATLASMRARLTWAAGDLRAARSHATSVIDAEEFPAESCINDVVALVDAWLVLALVADVEGRSMDASAALRRAVEIAGEHHLVRPFLVTGSDRIPVLLRRLADGQVFHESEPFLAELLAQVAPRRPPATDPPSLREPLTARELAMLVELPTMKSNAEIAREYFVSVNTVKAHLKNVYRKLDVDSRRSAVRRARELDLLP